MKKGLLIAGAAIFAALSLATMSTAAFADAYEEDDADEFAYEMATGGYRDLVDGLESGEYQGPGRLYGDTIDDDEDDEDDDEDDDDDDDDDE